MFVAFSTLSGYKIRRIRLILAILLRLLSYILVLLYKNVIYIADTHAIILLKINYG